MIDIDRSIDRVLYFGSFRMKLLSLAIVSSMSSVWICILFRFASLQVRFDLNTVILQIPAEFLLGKYVEWKRCVLCFGFKKFGD